MEQEQNLEEYCQYLAYLVHALVMRCGGEVTIVPTEVYDGARREAAWARVGNNISIKLGALCQE